MLSIKRKILVGMVVLMFMVVVVAPVVADMKDIFVSPSGFGDKGVKVWEKRTDEYVEIQYWKINPLALDEQDMKILDTLTSAAGYTSINVEAYNMVHKGYRKIPTPDDVAYSMMHVEPEVNIIMTKSLEDPQDVKFDYVDARWATPLFEGTPLFERGRRELCDEDILPRSPMNSVEEEEKWKKRAEHLRLILSNIPISTQTPEPLTEIKIDEEKIKRISDEQNKLIPPPKSLPEEPSETLGGINFTSIQLNYISTFSDQEFGIFNYALKAKKAEKGSKIIDIEDATELSLNAFFIGLTLPESDFWVNLNPWEPDVIIDENLGKTDIGRIMLEADLQMKRDFCKYKNPNESEVAEEYWGLYTAKLKELTEGCAEKHPEEIKDARDIYFVPLTRHWIVPDKTNAYEEENEVYIDDTTFTIFSEPVFQYSTWDIVGQNSSLLSQECKDDLNSSAIELGYYVYANEHDLILPLVVREVNYGRNYSALRQVYTSLALAQWYKDKYGYTSGIFTDCINSGNLTGFESKTAWNAEGIWGDYVKSFEEGEYHFWINKTYTEGRYIVTKCDFYTCGGVDFTDIRITDIGDISPEIEELTSEAIYGSFSKKRNEYYFGDGLYVFYPTSTLTPTFSPTTIKPSKYPKTEVPSPTQPGFEAIFVISGLLVVAYLIMWKNNRKEG